MFGPRLLPSAVEAIGCTPLVELSRFVAASGIPPGGGRILAKACIITFSRAHARACWCEASGALVAPSEREPTHTATTVTYLPLRLWSRPRPPATPPHPALLSPSSNI